MSTSCRATQAELAVEFERAMGSLATDPITDLSPNVVAVIVRGWCDAIEREQSRVFGREDITLAALTRIAAIALEGAARLRRGT